MAKKLPTKIEQCDECPYHYYVDSGIGYKCRHTERELTHLMKPLPEWCPLEDV